MAATCTLTSRPAGDVSLFSEHRRLIEAVIRTVIRRRRMTRDEAEDFASVARLGLLEDGCAVIRNFRGESSLSTFLIRVVDRMLLDYRVENWGKWRPSARARRLGRLAMQLEKLTSRDGLTFDEAAETLRTNFQVARTDAELWAIYRQLPERTPRVLLADDALTTIPASIASFDEGPRADGAWMIGALVRALSRLEPEDRMLLHQRFFGGIRTVRIARARGLDQKRLYARFSRILGKLRVCLEAEGVEPSAVREWIDNRGGDARCRSIAAFPPGDGAHMACRSVRGGAAPG
jgi:RNA polymerase sigma factor for flagellar operon FliA